MARQVPTTAAAGGELGLVVAILLQALKDRRSHRRDVRVEAEEFWRDDQRVQWWADLAGLDTDVLQQAVR
jgi:hypothetical protein